MTTRTIDGLEAIEYAELHGVTLHKHADPTEEARGGLTPDEAREIAAEDPSLIWLPEPEDGYPAIRVTDWDRHDDGDGRWWIEGTVAGVATGAWLLTDGTHELNDHRAWSIEGDMEGAGLDPDGPLARRLIDAWDAHMTETYHADLLIAADARGPVRPVEPLDDPELIMAVDLAAEVEAMPEGAAWEAWRLVYQGGQRGDLLILRDEGRVGIATGSDADWFDVDPGESAERICWRYVTGEVVR